MNWFTDSPSYGLRTLNKLFILWNIHKWRHRPTPSLKDVFMNDSSTASILVSKTTNPVVLQLLFFEESDRSKKLAYSRPTILFFSSRQKCQSFLWYLQWILILHKARLFMFKVIFVHVLKFEYLNLFQVRQPSQSWRWSELWKSWRSKVGTRSTSPWRTTRLRRNRTTASFVTFADR